MVKGIGWHGCFLVARSWVHEGYRPSHKWLSPYKENERNRKNQVKSMSLGQMVKVVTCQSREPSALPRV